MAEREGNSGLGRGQPGQGGEAREADLPGSGGHAGVAEGVADGGQHEVPEVLQRVAHHFEAVQDFHRQLPPLCPFVKPKPRPMPPPSNTVSPIITF